MPVASSFDSIALLRLFPQLREHTPWIVLGNYPTPVEPLRDHPNVFIKREDATSPVYGGNKVRTLETHLAAAVTAGARRIWATGAFGSNHSVATVLHARAAGLDAGIALFPQPWTPTSHANLLATLSASPAIARVPNVALLPVTMTALNFGRHRSDYLMGPGGATPLGALGHVSAGLELAEQIASGQLPAPVRVIVAVGSTCTTAGLLVGTSLAERLGICQAPAITAVRVTPWPITSQTLITHLARKTSRALARKLGDVAAFSYRELSARLTVEGRYFGRGYGHPTPSGLAAIREMADAHGPPLDVVYSAKSGAALFDLARAAASETLVFWATKSSAPLPEATAEQIALAPRQMQRWLAHGP